MASFFKTLGFTVLIPGSVAVYVPMSILDHVGGPDIRIPFPWLAFLPLLCGLVFYLWSAYDFVASGRGTPAPVDPPKTLVVRGLYRVVRNPMYVGVMSVLIGEVWYFGSAALAGYSLCIFTLFSVFIRRYEEPTLARLFGDAYAAYCDSVPRWIPDWRKIARPSPTPGQKDREHV